MQLAAVPTQYIGRGTYSTFRMIPKYLTYVDAYGNEIVFLILIALRMCSYTRQYVYLLITTAVVRITFNMDV